MSKTDAEKMKDFLRVGCPRMSKAVKAIELLEKLGNKNSYSAKESWILQFIDRLKTAINRVETALTTGKIVSDFQITVSAEEQQTLEALGVFEGDNAPQVIVSETSVQSENEIFEEIDSENE